MLEKNDEIEQYIDQSIQILISLKENLSLQHLENIDITLVSIDLMDFCSHLSGFSNLKSLELNLRKKLSLFIVSHDDIYFIFGFANLV